MHPRFPFRQWRMLPRQSISGLGNSYEILKEWAVQKAMRARARGRGLHVPWRKQWWEPISASLAESQALTLSIRPVSVPTTSSQLLRSQELCSLLVGLSSSRSHPLKCTQQLPPPSCSHCRFPNSNTYSGVHHSPLQLVISCWARNSSELKPLPSLQLTATPWSLSTVGCCPKSSNK